MPGEPDLLEGIEDMEAVVDALVAAGPEALLLTPGQAELLQRKVGRAKPALVLRVDTGNVFGREVPERPASWMYDDPVGPRRAPRRGLRDRQPAGLAGPAVAA